MKFIRPILMWTTPKDVTETKNIEGSAKVLGKDFLIPENKKGNLVTKNGILNGNTIVLGAIGSGKTYMYIKPNIKANLGKKNFIWVGCGYSLDELKDLMPGYDIKYLSMPNKEGNVSYNPFKYVSNKADLIVFANAIFDYIDAKYPQTNINGDPFYESVRKILLQAILTYAYLTIPKDKLSFTSICNVLENMLQAKNKHDYIQKIIDTLNKKEPDSEIEIFTALLNTPPKTLDAAFKSIFPLYATLYGGISNIFDVDTLNIMDIFTKDNQAIVVPCNSFDTEYNYITSILVEQILNQRYMSYESPGFKNKLVDLYLDEFANYDFNSFLPYAISTNRNYGINIHIMLQTLSQGYKKYNDFDIITANCDTEVYMGSQSYEDAEIICNEYLKNTPAFIVNASKTKSILREAYIMTPDELLQLNPNNQLVFIRTYNPMQIEKAKIVK